jgi:CBS domain-containing protein
VAGGWAVAADAQEKAARSGATSGTMRIRGTLPEVSSCVKRDSGAVDPAQRNRYVPRNMNAKDLMQESPVTIQEDATIAQLCDRMQAAHVNALPVLGETGELAGIVSEEDVLYGAMGIPQDDAGPTVAGLVRDIMTAPAVCATPDTDVAELCRMMWGMRIHHIPIVEGERVVGMVSSLELVRAVAEGKLGP